MKKTYLQLLATQNFSIIPCREDKRPLGAWKEYQEKARTEIEIEALNSPLFGIITGFDYLEVVDIDLKVLSTAKEQKNWWDEYLSFLQDNILDFDEKFVIKKTLNNGYHIIYKSKRVQGNTKIASLKGHKEAILESRGIGGMVIIYEKTFGKLNYQDVQFISDEDREILWQISETYNYIEEQKVIIPKKEKKEYNIIDGNITPWDDFNNKNNVLDIVADEFTLVRNLNDKYIIKRIGATSTHSGYIYKDKDLMYLFSTGSNYEHEKQYSAFSAYVRKHFNDDFSEATKQIYKDGYGSRVVRKEQEPDIKEVLNKEDLTFPIEIFPEPIQAYLLEAKETLNHSIDYMACSLLWVISVSIGNSMKIEIIPGWTENSTIWMSIVGKPGWGKTPSIKRIISPLEKLNSREVKKYHDEMEKFNFYDKLSAKDKKDYPETFKPTKKQFIANDITVEALVDIHGERDIGVGVMKDEQAGWFKDMNKYREGSDKEFWLSCWSGSPVIITRISRVGSYIETPCIPVLGGIQPGVLNEFNNSENKENGFMDRMLLCYPDLKSEYLSRKKMDYDSIQWYSDRIVSFFDFIQHKIVKRDIDGSIDPFISKMSNEAFEVYDKRHREITDIENDEQENQYLKSMLPKQKAYIARFSLLIHVFDDYFKQDGKALEISKESVLKAIRLSDYFIETAKKIKITSSEVNEVRRILDKNKNKTKKELTKAVWESDNNFNRTDLAEIIDASTRTVRRYVTEFEENSK
jgi:hypothetical protein